MEHPEFFRDDDVLHTQLTGVHYYASPFEVEGIDDARHPGDGDFVQSDVYARDRDEWHTRALRHREHQLYGEHFDTHYAEYHHVHPWFPSEPYHMEGGHNIHYEGHGLPQHSRLQWPTEAEEERVIQEDGKFHHRFVHQMQRDHDIIDYQHELAHPTFISYEDPHLHAPLSEISDHDPIIDEHRPSDEDFYSFQ